MRALRACKAQGWFLAAGLAGEVGLWRLDGRGTIRSWHLGTRVFDCDLSWDCRQVACALGDGRVLVWDPEVGPGHARLVTRFTGPATAVAFHPSGRLLAAGSRAGEVRAVSWPAGRVLASLRGHGRWVNSLAFSPWWDLLASAGDDRRVWIWDTDTWQPLLVLPTSREAVAVAFSPDGRTLAVGDGRLVRFYPMDLSGRRSFTRSAADMARRLPVLPPKVVQDLERLSEGDSQP